MRFFFYGSLMQASGNQFATRLHRHLHPGASGSVTGRLYRVRHDGQWHKALIVDPSGREIAGMVFNTKTCGI